MTEFSLKIYGCRGSIPVSGPAHARYGGETSCAVVTAGTRTIVLDAGSGLRKFGHEVNHADPRVYIFVSHVHLDHIIGLPYFSGMYRPDASIYLWGPRDPRGGDFRSSIEQFIQPPYHPVSLSEMLAQKHFYDFGEGQVVYFLKGVEAPVQLNALHPSDRDKIPDASLVEAKISCMRGYGHPKSGVNIYRVDCGDKSVVYATDTEGYVQGDRRLIDFSQDANLIIHDAMYTDERYVSMPVPTQGYGHSTVQIACKLAQTANVEKLVLWHHDPISTDDALDDIYKNAKTHFSNTIIGMDGLEISI